MTLTLLGGGSGVGESVVLKFAGNQYGIIDSFMDRRAKMPAALAYLIQQGVSPSTVRFVLLTHYHQDHRVGIAEILRQCQQAEFFVSQSLTTQYFSALLAAYASEPSTRNFFSEYADAVRTIRSTGRKIRPLTSGSQPLISTGNVRIEALSPHANDVEYVDVHLRKHLTLVEQTPGIVLPVRLPHLNYQSVVLQCYDADKGILLGADLEHHPVRTDIGWEQIYTDGRILPSSICLLKTPHHGSENGCHFDKWKLFLRSDAHLNLTPFAKGRKKLPAPDMVHKLLNFGKATYITGNGKPGKIPAKTLKQLAGLKVGAKSKNVGVIKTTKSTSVDETEVELQGGAIPLEKFDLK